MKCDIEHEVRRYKNGKNEYAIYVYLTGAQDSRAT